MSDLETKIKKRIYEFDVISLLQLLKHLDYSPKDIQFKSNFSITSQPHLIHDIEFQDEPLRQVIITMNIGLLSAQSPLPTYFFKKIDHMDMGTQDFIEFIGFFDHLLIWNYLVNIYPEINTSLYQDWELTKYRYLQMLDLKSHNVLHWLFQMIYPELAVKIERTKLRSNLKTSSIKLGKTVIGGDAVFGKNVNIPICGNTITLSSKEEFTYTGEPWSKEIKHRLEYLVFPILRSVRAALEIVLVIQTRKRWAKLHSESYLGYDSIRGGKAQFRRIRVFQGVIS